MVAIQWYPGHMEKARREMSDHLKAVDMVIELRDARIPKSSRNPMLDQMAQGKPKLILLSKADLADPEETEKWLKSLGTKPDQKAMALDLQKDNSYRQKIVSACLELTEPKRQRMIRRGIHPRLMRAMVCGVPNAGKSTLINRIAGKNQVRTADKPGVTRKLVWIKADPNLEILDTPGVLWPKFSDPKTGSLLAATGAINEDILNLEEIAMDTIHTIRSRYPGVLEAAYGAEENIRTDVMLDQIAVYRHLAAAGEQPDRKRAAGLFLHEMRRGRLGRFTLESPDENENSTSVSE